MFDLLHQWMVHVESGGAHFNGQGAPIKILDHSSGKVIDPSSNNCLTDQLGNCHYNSEITVKTCFEGPCPAPPMTNEEFAARMGWGFDNADGEDYCAGSPFCGEDGDEFEYNTLGNTYVT